MAAKRLTDRKLKALKPAAKGKRYDVPDGDVRGLAVRVTDKGQRSFVLVARFPGSTNPTRRALGVYPTLTLESARNKARAWHDLIAKGIDPKEHERREAEGNKRQAAAEQANTFGAVAERYIAQHLKGQRRARDAERDIRRELIPRWGNRAMTHITRADVIAMVEEIADERGHKAMARNMLGHAITLFNWAFDRDLIEHSPCDRVRASKLIGEKKPRKRVLSDAELFAMWRASGRLGYPFGPLIRLLMLTGTRRNEAAGARWREFDLGGPRHPIWTIPPARFKSDATHLVPVTDDILAVLDGLPQFKSRPGARVSDHLFSTTNGERPVSGYSKAKQRLDTLMLQTLKAAARRRGDDPSAVELAPFVVHDIRRTVRTRLSALRVPTVVAEMVIGHGLRGIQREYDQHEYLPEKREALEAWAAMLRGIVEPTPANVVRLDGRDMNTGVSA